MSETEGPAAEIEQPQVTADTKFRRGGFRPAAEVIAESEAAPAGAMPESDDAVMAAAIAADDSVGFENPEGVTLEGFAQPEAQPAEGSEAPPQPQEAKVKIGGREFATQEEAWAYAEELERARDAADAFRQGVELARQQAPGNPPPAPAEPEEIDPEYYTNPQEYFRKREAQILAKAEERVTQSLRKQESERQVWTGFYSQYPDLQKVPQVVDLVYRENFARLQNVELNQALKEIATKTRGILQGYVEERMPKVELPKVARAATPTGAPGVTSPKQETKPLNFAQQMKNLKKGKVAPR